MISKSLKGKIVWITGGKRIGQEIAVGLAQLGADLVLSYRRSEKEAQDTAKKAKKLGRKVSVIKCDTADSEGVQKAVNEIKKEFENIGVDLY